MEIYVAHNHISFDWFQIYGYKLYIDIFSLLIWQYSKISLHIFYEFVPIFDYILYLRHIYKYVQTVKGKFFLTDFKFMHTNFILILFSLLIRQYSHTSSRSFYEFVPIFYYIIMFLKKINYLVGLFFFCLQIFIIFQLYNHHPRTSANMCVSDADFKIINKKIPGL